MKKQGADEDKIMKKKNSYHPLYALYFTLNGLDLIKINNIDFTNLAIISHHTTLHKEIYPIEKFNNLNVGMKTPLKNFLKKIG